MEGIERRILNEAVEPNAVGYHNFDVGFRKGLSILRLAVAMTKELIIEKEKRENG